MTSITAAGTGSGLDIETIIETLTEAERAPTESRLATREIEIQADISAYGSLKSALTDFQAAFSGLSSLKDRCQFCGLARGTHSNQINAF